MIMLLTLMLLLLFFVVNRRNLTVTAIYYAVSVGYVILSARRYLLNAAA